MNQQFIAKELLLIGGGHAHVILLRMLGMKPIPGLQVTLVSPDVRTPYSGMLPGVVAGHYTQDDIHIDLVRLCRFAGARFIRGTVSHIDAAGKSVQVEGRPDLGYDVLSMNIGITPSVSNVKLNQDVIAVKPISKFLKQWDLFMQRAHKGDLKNVCVVGAGAGGVELALSIDQRLTSLYASSTAMTERPQVSIVTRDERILKGYPARVQDHFEAVMKERSVNIVATFDVSDVTATQIGSSDGMSIEAEDVFWVTGAAPQHWMAHSGFDTNDAGFINVDETLRCVGNASVFAVGDIANMVNDARPKAGVYAVRQGPVLYENIKRTLLGKKLKKFKPQKEFLSIVTTGGKHAIAAKNGLSISGAWVWQWKNWIDKRFMKQFSQFPVMSEPKNTGLLRNNDAQMACGGCGSKVSGDLLSSVLSGLGIVTSELDDAAIFEVPTGQLMLHTVDGFRSFIDDPYRFSEVTVQHALSDIYAMGGTPKTALAMVTVPYAESAITQRILEQLLAGTKAALDREGVELVGGHTAEASELSLAFAVNGIVDPASLMRKSNLQAGDCLILTKPLGTGCLFAADMQARAEGEWISDALDSMALSNRKSMEVFREKGVTACTYVTGFGLAGHLLEMLHAGNLSACLNLDALPLYDGTDAVYYQASIKSTLHDANRQAAQTVQASKHRNFPFLFDPQTSGGLLAAVKSTQVEATLIALKGKGYTQAACIGTIGARSENDIEFS
jgi:selenide,water dikinase